MKYSLYMNKDSCDRDALLNEIVGGLRLLQANDLMLFKGLFALIYEIEGKRRDIQWDAEWTTSLWGGPPTLAPDPDYEPKMSYGDLTTRLVYQALLSKARVGAPEVVFGQP